ncbi:hypothetical protein [Microbacterium stercoris]|uniref:Uncharacterized protein n=1 Tax=Microbacterium stercoris TaxID=2820289 RepID=A0A939QIZ2_9MICO|nr:hypothetical protein [Microbacterium stercoris]MBO3663738.1 hypothetical protein [Microbacterium stercoris]
MTLLRLLSNELDIRQSPQGESRVEGLYVRRDAFDGWDDGVAMRSDTVARPQAHGDFDMPGFLAGRLMPFSGWAIAERPASLEMLRDRFIGHGADGAKFRVTVIRNGRELWADARLAAGQVPTFKDVGTGRRAAWKTAWWFPDPRKYGHLHTFGPAATVQAFHEGNFPALSELVVTGSAAGGYTITGPGGREIVISRPLVSGTPHRFEMRTGRLYVGGSRVIGGVARAELFTIPSGLPATEISVSAGLLTVEVHDTYI